MLVVGSDALTSSLLCVGRTRSVEPVPSDQDRHCRQPAQQQHTLTLHRMIVERQAVTEMTYSEQVSDTRGNVLWMLGGSALVAIVVAGMLISPVVALAGAVGIGLLIWAAVKGKGRYRGVAVLGAVASTVVIPPLHTPIPGWAGITVGAVWLVLFGLLAARRGQRGGWGTYTLFALLAATGLISSALIRPFPYVGVVILFLVAVGLLARGLREDEWRVVRRGLVILATLEAIICILEFILFRGDPLDAKAGPHPVLAGFERPEGTLGHPIVAGLAIMAGLLIVLAYSGRGPLKMILLVVLLGGIFTTGSSSVYISALVGVLLQTVLTGRTGWRVAKSLIVAGIGAYFIVHEAILAPLIDDVSGNNSTHRLNSIRAIPDLVTLRPPLEGLLGSGWGSETLNYQSGYLVNDYFYSVDNMFTTTMMAAGVAGFVLFSGLLLRTFIDADSRGRITIITLAVMLFSFDVFQWASSGSLVLVILLNAREPNHAPVSTPSDAIEAPARSVRGMQPVVG